MRAIFTSIRRGFLRVLLLIALGTTLLVLSNSFPLILGSTAAPLLFGFGLTFLGLAVGDLALRVLQPGIDGQLAGRKALDNNSIAAALVYLGRCLLAGVILMLIVTAARAGEIEQKTNEPRKYAILWLSNPLERPNAEVYSLYCYLSSNRPAIRRLHQNWSNT